MENLRFNFNKSVIAIINCITIQGFNLSSFMTK